MNKALVVLAAGMGSRYGGLKQLDPVGPSDECILDYSVFDARRAGFDQVVFVIRPDIEAAFKEHIGNKLANHIRVDYTFQELDHLPEGFVPPPERTRPWGTGQALLSAAACTSTPMAVINADDFYGRDSFSRIAGFLDKTHGDPTSYAMVGFQLANTLPPSGTVSRAICDMTPNGMLTKLTELTHIARTTAGIQSDELVLTGRESVSMNMFGFKPSIFNYMRAAFIQFLEASGSKMDSELFMPLVVDQLITRGLVSVRVLDTTSRWFGVTNPEDRDYVKERLQTLVDAGDYPDSLWK